MISTVAWVAGAGCGVTAAPGRTRPSGALPAAARVHTAVQPDMQHGTFGGARTLVLPTARRRTCSRPPARLPPCAAKGSDSDLEVEILEKQGFQGLASAVANKLASGLAQQEGGLNRIGRWLEAGAKEARAQEAQPEEPGETGKQQSPLRKAASIVGGVLGASGAVRGWVSEQSPVTAAAHYLGVDSVNLNVDTLKGWLTNPRRKDDVKMVGALVYKMLQSLEAETGEPFKGKDHQYRLLYTLATELFGGSVKARVVRALVDSFIKVASR